MIAKLVTQILATSIRSKVLDFPSKLIFDLILKFLELFKGFRLVLHQVNIPISTQVISKGHEVTKIIASRDVHGSTYIRVYDPQYDHLYGVQDIRGSTSVDLSKGIVVLPPSLSFFLLFLFFCIF